MSKLYFFRHGQASLGADNYDVLSDKGVQQSALLGDYLVRENIHFDQLFVGPLERQKDTLKTVEGIYAKNQLAFPKAKEIMGMKEHRGMETMKKALPHLLTTNPYLKELAAATQKNPSLGKRNGMLGFQYFLSEWAAGAITVEGMPSWKSFREEVKVGLAEILTATQAGQTVGVFSSGGTISAITAECIGLTDEKKVAQLNFSIRNTSFTSFLHNEMHFNLLSFNELPHLKNEMITFV